MIKRDDYKMGEVVVNNRLHELWYRNEEHELGKMNDGSPNLWVKYITMHSCSGDNDKYDWIPWLDRGSNRYSFEITIKQGNRTKCKWGDTDIRSTGECIISCNKREVYSFMFGDIGYAYAKAQQLTYELAEHPALNLINPDEIIGRKIWYDNQPALVERWCETDLWVVPDPKYISKFNMAKQYHDDFMAEYNEEYEDGLRLDLMSESIWWFRDEEE